MHKCKTATILYATSLCLYIIACFNFGSAEMRIDIGTLVFSIIPVYIVLFWSLDETREETREQIEALQKFTAEQISVLKESTKLQIDSFSTQSEGIVSAIQQVVGAIGQMSEDMRKQMEKQEKALAEIQRQNEARLRAQEQQAQKEWQEKERIAPRIFARLASEPFFFFFTHYRLYIYNTGGLAKNMDLIYFFSNTHKTGKKTISIGALSRDEAARPIDCGDIRAYANYTILQISVSLRDREERLYDGTITIDKSYRDWTQFRLEERPGE